MGLVHGLEPPEYINFSLLIVVIHRNLLSQAADKQ